MKGEARNGPIESQWGEKILRPAEQADGAINAIGPYEEFSDL